MLDYRHEVDPDTGERFLRVAARGEELLKNPLLNKGTAFDREERDEFGLHGLLPDQVSTMDEQLVRVRNQFDRKSSDMDKNVYLNGLMDRNETLFYRFVMDNLEETIPLIYTPTVAYACRHWSRILRRSRGIYVTPRDRGRIEQVLRVRRGFHPAVIVVTDNERILGIGDQGAGGMGIPIGKLALYAAGAGINPARLVPVSLDVGTDNPELLADPIYVGYREHRLRGEPYEALIEEFVSAVESVYPGALLQWEDFANTTSFANLDRYRHRLPSFNDDIQGTAAMVVAGLMAAGRHIGIRMRDHRVVIVGAGSAGIGTRDLIAAAMLGDGASLDEVSSRVFVLDSRGLLVEGRGSTTAAKERLAVPRGVVAPWGVEGERIGLEDVVSHVRPTVLIGLSGIPGVFSAPVVATMAAAVDRPIIMPLSNPTSHAELTPADALRWSEGRAIVATGSPFAPVAVGDRLRVIGQANNVFIFPGMGLGALAVGAREVTDGMFLAAARALGSLIDDDLLDRGQIFPPIDRIRAASAGVAKAVAIEAIESGVAKEPANLDAEIGAAVWEPEYVRYRPAG